MENRYEHEVEEAEAAIELARAQIIELEPSLDEQQRKALRSIRASLKRAMSPPWNVVFPGHPAVRAYEAARRALAQLERLQHDLPYDTKSRVNDTIAALHRAEDAVRDPYWHGNLR